jgi:ribosomal protein S18 acetylase RimI-like enzyme
VEARPPFYIRTASVRDLPAVSALLGVTWHATYDRLYGAEKVTAITSEWHSVAALQRRLDSPNSEFLLADDGKSLLGMAFASASRRLVTLHQLYVLPAHQGRGVGVQLLEEVLECFFDAERITLEVDPGNAGAIEFYKRYGFAETGRTENCGTGQSGIPALIFERQLA